MLHMSNAVSITFDAPLVASPKQAMIVIQVSRKKLYEPINTGRVGKLHRRQIATHHSQVDKRLHRAQTGSRSGSARPRCILRR